MKGTRLFYAFTLLLLMRRKYKNTGYNLCTFRYRKTFWSETLLTTLDNFALPQAIERVCQGETLVILPDTGKMLTLAITNEVRRNLEEPNNEHILRGSHEGLVERADTNLTLIRKRVNNPALVVKSFTIGQQTNTKAYYLYMDGVIQPETLQEMEKRIADIKIDYFIVLAS